MTGRKIGLGFRCWAVALSLLIFSSGAFAVPTDKDKQEANDYYLKAVSLLDEGKASAALSLLEKAEAVLPHPKILAAKGTALLKLARYLDAALLFEKTLALRDLKPELRTYAVDGLAKAEVRLARLQIKSNRVEGAEASIDGEGSWTLPATVRVSAGRHVVSATAPGRKPATQTVTVSEGDLRKVDLSLLPEEAPKGAVGIDTTVTEVPVNVTEQPVTDDTDRGSGTKRSGSGTRWGLWAGVGVVVVAVVVGSVIVVAGRDPGVDHVPGVATDLGEKTVTF